MTKRGIESRSNLRRCGARITERKGQPRKGCPSYQQALALALARAEVSQRSAGQSISNSVSRLLIAGGCHLDCTDSLLGNGVCDAACNAESCNFDDGDCELPAPAVMMCPQPCLPRHPSVCDLDLQPGHAHHHIICQLTS